VNAAEELISRARQGHFREVLPDLLELATRADGSRDQAWEAAAAAIQILFWQDRFAEASDLAATLIERDGPLGGSLCDQDMPFDEAFLAAEAHAGAPAAPRLQEAAGHVPAGRNLNGALLGLVEDVRELSPAELLPNYADWGGPAKRLDKQAAELADRGLAALDATGKSRLWQALMKANDFERAHTLAEAAGEMPDRFAVSTWLAGWYATRGDVALGERMLLNAHSQWWPYMQWDAIPSVPVLQPALRLVTTDRVREHYLTRPIGPEAEKNA
jgi:hypothetical protein